MDFDKKIERFPEQEDFLTTIAKKRMFHILDKIILVLGFETIQIAKTVNYNWRIILDVYLKSKIPRIRKFIARINPVGKKVCKLENA
jgi:hypothetical protein